MSKFRFWAAASLALLLTPALLQKRQVAMVGGNIKDGAFNKREFLNALPGPGGEDLSYTRLESCCAFHSPNGFMGDGLLDRYKIKTAGAEKPVIIFIICMTNLS